MAGGASSLLALVFVGAAGCWQQLLVHMASYGVGVRRYHALL